jgi:predicted CXXCH cytochrome family protein
MEASAGRYVVGLLLGSALMAAAVRGAPRDRPLGQAPPAGLGAGEQTCVACHDELVQRFGRTVHGRLASFEVRGGPRGCEACHGPTAAHAESGDPSAIRSFAALGAREASAVCETCHRADRALHWAGGPHAASGVGCTSCHRIHGQPGADGLGRPAAATTPGALGPGLARASLVRREPELCFTCHLDKRAKFWSSSHHPVREGSMTCSQCHDVHGTVGAGSLLRAPEGPNELCTRCHPAQRGPFVFEHAPVEESCLTCHDPHGAVANNLLKQGEPFLCLQCHEMHFHNARLAPTTPYFLPAGGSLNPNGATGFQRAFGTRCTACHTKIHGSDLPSQGVTGRGKALIR